MQKSIYCNILSEKDSLCYYEIIGYLKTMKGGKDNDQQVKSDDPESRSICLRNRYIYCSADFSGLPDTLVSVC